MTERSGSQLPADEGPIQVWRVNEAECGRRGLPTPPTCSPKYPAEFGVSQEEGAGDEKDMSAADCGGMGRQGHVRCHAWGMPRKLRSRRERVGAGTEFGELEHDRRWVIHPQPVLSPWPGSEVATRCRARVRATTAWCRPVAGAVPKRPSSRTRFANLASQRVWSIDENHSCLRRFNDRRRPALGQSSAAPH